MGNNYLDLLKLALIFAAFGVALSTSQYWYRARWYRNPIGIGLQGERFALLITIGLVILSVFFLLNRFDSQIIAWIQLAMMFIIGAFNVFLAYVFERIYRRERAKRVPAGGRHRQPGPLSRAMEKLRAVLDRG